MNPLFSLIYTSVRANCIKPMVKEWLSKARRPEAVEVIIALDANDQKSQDSVKTLKEMLSPHQMPAEIQVFVQTIPPFDCVKGWNLAASKATGKVLVQLTDDIHPPDAWDTKLLALEPANWPDTDAAIHVEDGYVHDLMVIGIITKVRYDRFGYFFYEGYQSLFCDTELTEVAYREQKVIQAKHLLFEHAHPDCNKRERDEVDKIHASQERWNLGELLFNYRRARGFPIDTGPKAVAPQDPGTPTPATAPAPPIFKCCAYIQATRDDLCLLEVCERMMEEGVNDFFFSVPDEYWSGRPTPVEDMTAVKLIADQVKAKGANVQCLFHKVKTYRFPGDSRIAVETRVRNDALSHIRQLGFEHVLIVDGDELWKRGTLNYVKRVVAKWNPPSINCLMIPVVGCPGYPIGGATDVAVIYVKSSVPFKQCRTPIGDQLALRMPLVIHFTGTRRTMEDTIRKHTDSGHFDDPDYMFAEFLEKVLPNIRPGFSHTYANGLKGLHFYKHYQIWNEVRNWMADEMAEIPKTLWPFLGGVPQEALAHNASAHVQTHK